MYTYNIYQWWVTDGISEVNCNCHISYYISADIGTDNVHVLHIRRQRKGRRLKCRGVHVEKLINEEMNDMSPDGIMLDDIIAADGLLYAM